MKKVTICLIGLGLLLALPQVLMAKGKPPGGGGGVFTPVDIDVSLYGSASEEASPWLGPYTTDRHPWTSDGWSWENGGTFFFDNWNANDLTVPVTTPPTPFTRPCHYTTVGALPATGGRYDCFEGGGETWPHGGRVSIDLTGITWVPAEAPRKGWKNEGYCDLLNDPSNFPPDGHLRFGVTRYQIYFMDGCDAKACDISMTANSYSGVWTTGVEDLNLVQLHPFHDLLGYPNIGILSVSGWTRGLKVGSGVNSPAAGELNVFTEAQNIPIDELTVTFSAVSNGADQVTCTTNDAEGYPTLLGLWLHTEPQQ